MNPITTFDPIVNPSGSIVTNGVNKGEQIVLFNSSLACLELEFQDKTTDVLPPSWARSWEKDFPLGKIKYSTLFTVPISGQPVSILYGTVYEPGEHVAHVNAPLQYVYIVGNPGGLPVANNTLSNTGQTPPFQVIYMQPSDAAAATVIWNNDGSLTIKTDNAGVLTQMLQIIAGASPQINLGASGAPTSFDGGLIVTDGQGRFVMPNAKSIRWKNSGGTSVPIIYLDASDITHLSSAGTGKHVQILDGDATIIADFTNSAGGGINFYNTTAGTNVKINDVTNNLVVGLGGADTISTHADGSSFGKIYLNSGRLHGIQGGSAAAGSGTVINHGLGNTPATVLLTPSIAQPGSGTVGAGSLNSTSFTCTIGAGSNVFWEAKNFV